MQYISHWDSPLGSLLLASDGKRLTGLWFAGQKYFAARLNPECQERDLPVFQQGKKWLDLYFSGIEPDFCPPLSLSGTPFQQEVWEILRTIPYGHTMTYGQIGEILAKKQGIPHMSAQAVGGAVGRNPISILVPCHRVVGAKGSLTGYAGGIERKAALLKLEKSKL